MRALHKIQILVFLFCFPMLIAQEQTTIGKMPDMDIRLLDGKKTTMYKLLDSGPFLGHMVQAMQAGHGTFEPIP